MTEVEQSSKLPPYVSAKSFFKLIENLKTLVPGQLDRGYMLNAAKFNGSTATQVLTATRFLGLVKGSTPEPILREWVKQEGDEWKRTLEKILRGAYAPIFELDLETATDGMVREAFRKAFGTDGEVAAKCIAFFITACERAGIKLSPIITKRARAGVGSGASAKARRRRGQPQAVETEQEVGPVFSSGNGAEAPRPPSTPTEVEWMKFRVLVDKFPRFDPTWPDELKARWFTAYEAFMKTNIGVKA